MNDVEEMNKQMDEEIKNSPALKMVFTQIRTMDERIKSLDKTQYGWCPKCGSLMGYVEEQNIAACTGNCGHWFNVEAIE